MPDGLEWLTAALTIWLAFALGYVLAARIAGAKEAE